MSNAWPVARGGAAARAGTSCHLVEAYVGGEIGMECRHPRKASHQPRRPPRRRQASGSPNRPPVADLPERGACARNRARRVRQKYCDGQLSFHGASVMSPMVRSPHAGRSPRGCRGSQLPCQLQYRGDLDFVPDVGLAGQRAPNSHLLDHRFCGHSVGNVDDNTLDPGTANCAGQCPPSPELAPPVTRAVCAERKAIELVPWPFV